MEKPNNRLIKRVEETSFLKLIRVLVFMSRPYGRSVVVDISYENSAKS